MFQVYPTATRALGLGTCSGMARVGALITPFIAQVGVAPNTEGVSLCVALGVCARPGLLLAIRPAEAALLYASEKAEAPESHGTCPTSHSREVEELGVRLGSF